MAMRRADRKTSNDDHAIKYPIGHQKEPVPTRELEQLLATVRNQRDEWQQKAKENEAAATQLVHFQQEIEIVQGELKDWKVQANNNHKLYLDEQYKQQEVLILYEQEKVKSIELLHKYQQTNTQLNTVVNERNEWENKYHTTLTLYQEANVQKETYLTLYHEAQTELKHERQSKAGIKGWNTRRKKENEKLKQEIGKMTLLLKDSLERKEEAVNNLYLVAERMERIQDLVDSVDNESSNTPIALLDKLKKIWQAIREILGE
ncbi:hypothetical protein [Aphanothece sacrum]|uniref:Uncharacterized protein n=1 Tax=Aphanothece sacrum FPU1 TaxID=1920663 RepID=A0A401IMD9_APHSA|nr:hypothetical protein [Aphanothece sacrum]GBF82424.1 hypothetical protein AsFPU1_3853 [Aphanothece sacrum FPU1]GBF84421.1 hypothetical protein AsFPU3_1470 [Aphanothece sacrum FPU3]